MIIRDVIVTVTTNHTYKTANAHEFRGLYRSKCKRKQQKQFLSIDEEDLTLLGVIEITEMHEELQFMVLNNLQQKIFNPYYRKKAKLEETIYHKHKRSSKLEEENM
ncbi:hypothetical protein CWI38_2027p0020 [Hamiltosporidium tvaerminnensis]|uniref:Uncharacterized protein n=1 Tax=Hamiltosporidium tvaerminnensis TaxID=1176355 RepID=A0A4Q9LP30_9MICR|nr:hypothetical protein CWI38_2027p0020 [Hamiltosporidium tvaerminnensis]